MTPLDGGPETGSLRAASKTSNSVQRLPSVRVLAIETSLKTGSIALCEFSEGGRDLVEQATLPDDQRTAQSLLPAVHDLCEQMSWQPLDIQLIAVTTGPGSFTGLRIGVTSAKTLAFALKVPLIGVNTLTALAAGVPEASGRLWAVLDAQRGELFVQPFDRAIGSNVRPASPVSILALDQWLQELGPGDSVVGPPLSKLQRDLPAEACAVDRAFWHPRASVVASVGRQEFATGRRDDPLQLVPNYYRRSAAEEKARRLS